MKTLTLSANETWLSSFLRKAELGGREVRWWLERASDVGISAKALLFRTPSPCPVSMAILLQRAATPPSVCFNLLTPSPLACAVHVLQGIGSSTGAWSTYKEPHTWRKLIPSPRSHQLPTTPQWGMGADELLPPPCWHADWLDLMCVLCGDHSYCELLSVAILPRPEDTVSVPLSLWLMWPSCSLFCNDPWALRKGCNKNVPTCDLVLHAHFYVLASLLSFCVSHHHWTKKFFGVVWALHWLWFRTGPTLALQNF